MRRHGWQLPYHPLQVVAIAVFLALGVAFYVFFLPFAFVGNRVFQYVVMALYTPSVTCVLFLYIWCAATDPGDPGVFKSKKYLNMEHNERHSNPSKSKQGGSINEEDVATEGNPVEDCIKTDAIVDNSSNKLGKEKSCCCITPFLAVLLGCFPLSLLCRCHAHEQSSEQQISEDGMFYCSLCEVEVRKYSKHCRVCDKCVDSFDHHCRWLNNCIGKRNYRRFFTLMISALLMLILQWSIGVLVLILSFLERKRFSAEIGTKLGSSFSLVPFIIVVGSCTIIAMLATLPLAQLFFFHVLLIKKGISTYDYIVALREQEQEQEQQGFGQQSPQMSSVSSLTGLSNASSFSAFRRDAWCTPPRLFLEDQFDVVPPVINMPFKNTGKKMMPEESTRKRSAGPVKISPWTLARLNAEEVSKAAAEAKKKSKILQPVVRGETLRGHETDGSYGGGSRGMATRQNNTKKVNRRDRLPKDLLEPLANISNSSKRPPEAASSSLAPLQLAARSAFQTSRAMSLTGIVASSPDSSLDSPDLHPFRVSSSGAEDSRGLMLLPSGAAPAEKGAQLLRSTSSDGYEASGGEDSDRVPSRIVHRSVNWSNLLFNSARGDVSDNSEVSSLAGSQARCT